MNWFLWIFTLLQIPRNLEKKWQIVSPLPYNTCVCIWLDSTGTSLQSRSIHSYSLPSKGSLDNHWTLQHMHNVNTSTTARDPSWKASFVAIELRAGKLHVHFFQFKREIKLNLDTKQGFASLVFSLICRMIVCNRQNKILETHSQLRKLRLIPGPKEALYQFCVKKNISQVFPVEGESKHLLLITQQRQKFKGSSFHC